MKSKIELEAWQRVAGLAQSPSHDFHHIERVQAYIDVLGEVLGVETPLIRLAAILHDLGRSDQNRRHGLASIEASKEMAEEVLHQLPLSDRDREQVVEAIEGHDQPEFHSEKPTVRILKDADFLAGFGAWGVLRIAMWSGETGRRIDDVLQRLTSGMQRRIEALEYRESKDVAAREVLFARQFFAELKRPVMMPPASRTGFYCVIEGVSGVGKNTIAKALCERLKKNGVRYRLVDEPGETFRTLRKSLGEAGGEADFIPLKKALFTADRAHQIASVVTPSLESGEVVISVRSYLSTAVYQTDGYADAYRTMLEHDWVPRPDLLILLETNTEVALARVKARAKPPGEFETEEHLSKHKEKYRELASAFPCRSFKLLDSSGSVEGVTEQAFGILSQALKLNTSMP